MDLVLFIFFLSILFYIFIFILFLLFILLLIILNLDEKCDVISCVTDVMHLSQLQVT